MINLEGFNQTSQESYWRVNQLVSEYGQPVVKAHLERIVIVLPPPEQLTSEIVRRMGKVTIAFED